MDKELERLYKIYGEQFVKYLTVELKRAGKNASGALINSLDYRLVPIAEDIVIKIESLDYFKWVDEGRRPGKYVPLKALESWCNLRGIPKSASFAINKSIFKFGIKPTNVLNKTDKIWADWLIKRFETDLVPIIETDIIKEFNKK